MSITSITFKTIYMAVHSGSKWLPEYDSWLMDNYNISTDMNYDWPLLHLAVINIINKNGPEIFRKVWSNKAVCTGRFDHNIVHHHITAIAYLAMVLEKSTDSKLLDWVNKNVCNNLDKCMKIVDGNGISCSRAVYPTDVTPNLMKIS